MKNFNSTMLAKAFSLSLSLSAIIMLLFLCETGVNAQPGCDGDCPYTNISTSLAGGWVKTFEVFGLDDVAWKFTPIDDASDLDTKKDNGLII
ncbi:MAG: hypothetical protein LH473_01045, partial [Chitinophagales bacterium]|nr:hypothetical protein [Chitinophagales bacterium]